MPRAPLYLPSPCFVEVTSRTIAGRKLFRPATALTERILGVIGRALDQFDVRMNVFDFMSNHTHYTLRAADAAEIVRFIAYFNKNTAHAAQAETGWRGAVWGSTHAVPILDELAAVRRLRYILSNGVKEGLVASPLDWPGASAARALLTGEPIHARWRPKGQPTPRPDDPSYTIELAPIPWWDDLPPAERRARIAELIRDIEEEGRILREGRPPAGVAAVIAGDSFECTPLERTPPPIAHTSSPALLSEFRNSRATFIAAVRAQSRHIRSDPAATTMRIPESFIPCHFVRRE